MAAKKAPAKAASSKAAVDMRNLHKAQEAAAMARRSNAPKSVAQACGPTMQDADADGM